MYYNILYFSENEFMCKWFIGLAFNKVENQNVDLTFDIQSFTNIGKFMCKWSVGLAFNKVENQNVDLTLETQSFTNVNDL